MPPDAIPRRPRPITDKHGGILSIVLVYAVFAACWILLSDKLVEIIFSDPGQIILVSMLKGWLFVGVTSLLLYGLMQHWAGSVTEPIATPARSLRLGRFFVLLATVIVAFTGTGIFNTIIHHREIEIARLQAVADLKTLQIADWLRERQGDADFIQTSGFSAELYRRWQESGDLNSGERLQIRLEQFRRNRGYAAVMVLNPSGEKLWGSDKSPLAIAPPLQAAVQLATTERKALHVGPYRGMAGNVRLDFVVPLTAISGPAPVVVLHIDLQDWFFPTLQTWPVPSVSGETALFRRDGDQVFFLNELRHQKDTAAKLRMPATTEKLLAAQVLHGKVVPGSRVEGIDYRGIPAIGVVRAITGTDWFLLAKIDQSELYAETVKDASWVSFVGLLALFITGSGHYLMRQNQQLAMTQAVQQTQTERLRALNLLATIADSSDDAIFAKDLKGRYTLFNRAAGNFVGKPIEDVLGCDDRAIFPPDQAEMVMGFDRRVIAENHTLTLEEELDTSDGKRIFMATKGPLHDAEGNIIGTFGISRDITQRKQVEAALHASELSYRSLFENMMNSYAHCLMLYENGEPRDFVYLDVNKAFEIQTGLKDVIGRKVSEVVPGLRESNPDLFEIYGRVAMSGQPERFETYVEVMRMWFSISVFSPQREHFVAVFDVITERKQAELALRDSERRFRQLFRLAPISLAIIDHNGVLVAVNDRFVSTFGYTHADVPTLAEWWPLAYPDPYYRRWVMEAWSAAVQRAVEQNIEIEPIEFRVHCKDGEVRMAEISGIMIGTDVLAILVDNTERRMAEDALRARERYQRAVLDNFPFMVWLKDTDSRLLAANKAYAQVANVADPDQLIGKTDLDFWEAELAEHYRTDDRAVLDSGQPKVIEEEITEAGRRFWIETYKSPVELDGHIIGTVGFSRDITLRKAANDALRRQTEELAQRNAELERFNRVMIGRELDMIALKQQINELSHQLGLKSPYPLAFLVASAVSPKDKDKDGQ